MDYHTTRASRADWREIISAPVAIAAFVPAAGFVVVAPVLTEGLDVWDAIRYLIPVLFLHAALTILGPLLMGWAVPWADDHIPEDPRWRCDGCWSRLVNGFVVGVLAGGAVGALVGLVLDPWAGMGWFVQPVLDRSLDEWVAHTGGPGL